MSDHWMHFFPADPRQPKLNWIHLQEQLAATGFIRARNGEDIRMEMLDNLKRLIFAARALPESDGERPGSLSDLAKQLIVAGVPLDSLALDYQSLTISQLIAALIDRGLLPSGFDYVSRQCYEPGPLFHEMCDVPHARYGWAYTEIYFEEFGEEIQPQIGEGVGPPGIPGTDRVVEEWIDFLVIWLADPNQKWTDPETGKAYDLLELDWDNFFGAGKSFISILNPGYLNGPRVTAFLGELTGQPFRFSWKHV